MNNSKKLEEFLSEHRHMSPSEDVLNYLFDQSFKNPSYLRTYLKELSRKYLLDPHNDTNFDKDKFFDKACHRIAELESGSDKAYLVEKLYCIVANPNAQPHYPSMMEAFRSSGVWYEKNTQNLNYLEYAARQDNGDMVLSMLKFNYLSNSPVNPSSILTSLYRDSSNRSGAKDWLMSALYEEGYVADSYITVRNNLQWFTPVHKYPEASIKAYVHHAQIYFSGLACERSVPETDSRLCYVPILPLIKPESLARGFLKFMPELTKNALEITVNTLAIIDSRTVLFYSTLSSEDGFKQAFETAIKKVNPSHAFVNFFDLIDRYTEYASEQRQEDRRKLAVDQLIAS